VVGGIGGPHRVVLEAVLGDLGFPWKSK
jgi:hypothetical protein